MAAVTLTHKTVHLSPESVQALALAIRQDIVERAEKTEGVKATRTTDPTIDKAASNLLVDISRSLGLFRRHIRTLEVHPGRVDYRYDDSYGQIVGAFGGYAPWEYDLESDNIRAAIHLFAAKVGVPINQLVSVRIDLGTPGLSIVSWRRKATKDDVGYVPGNKVEHRKEFHFVGETHA